MESAPPKPLNAYSGELNSVPESITEISKFSVYNLREILRFHNILDCSTKDELIIRVGMLKSGRSYLAFHKEMEVMVDLVAAITSIIAAQKLMYLQDSRILHKRGKFSQLLQQVPSAQKGLETVPPYQRGSRAHS